MEVYRGKGEKCEGMIKLKDTGDYFDVDSSKTACSGQNKNPR